MNSRDEDGGRHQAKRSHVVLTENRQPLPIRTISSAVLFAGDQEIGIEHGGSLYRLKITRQGKLILNK